MRHGRWLITAVLACALAAGAAVLVLSSFGVFDVQVWERETPLRAPVAVTDVRDGVMTLADGRTFRPAGIQRRESVSQDAYDDTLRVIAAQGVIVTRDIGDGSALLLAEPRFYNWCGTRGYQGNPRARLAGFYVQCPLSEAMIHWGYAVPDLDQEGLTPHERWRLEGAEHIGGVPGEPRQVSRELVALRLDGNERLMTDFDGVVALMWKPPPVP